MWIRPIALSALAAALLAAAPAQAQFPRVAAQPRDYTLELAFDSWTPDPGLVLRTAGAPDVDLVKTFGLEAERFKQYAVSLRPARKHKLTFQRVEMRYEQATTLTETIAFSGQTYEVNLPANLRMDWKLTRIGYQWDVVSAPAGYLGVTGDLKYNQIAATITATGAGTGAVDTTAPIPTIGVAAGGYLLPKVLSVALEVSGFQLPKQDDREGRFLDYDIHVTGHLGRALGLRAGYRSVDVRYLIDGDRGALKMKGPYLGASLRF